MRSVLRNGTGNSISSPAALWERGHWHYTATRISQPHYYTCNGYSYFQSN